MAVAYNLINFSMPKKDEEWAKKTTEDLRNDILVSHIFLLKKKI